MPDVFDCLAEYVYSKCGEELVCAHVGDVQECQVKQHHSYAKFRSRAVAARATRKPSQLWESMVAMGRISDMRGDGTWRMIVLDCLVPFLRARSWSISKEFYRDLEDVRSDMFEAALNSWEETVSGVPHREVPTLMFRAANNAAYRGANMHRDESPTDEREIVSVLEEASVESALKASSILHDIDPMDPAVAEQIRGERTGALWQRYGLIDVVNRHHEDLRAGRRPGIRDALATEAMLARTWVSGFNHYYRVSDLYPKFVALPAAAEALGIAKTTAYRMVGAGSFPCLTTRIKGSIHVPTAALMHSLSVPDVIVHIDDVENGATHADGD